MRIFAFLSVFCLQSFYIYITFENIVSVAYTISNRVGKNNENVKINGCERRFINIYVTKTCGEMGVRDFKTKLK